MKVRTKGEEEIGWLKDILLRVMRVPTSGDGMVEPGGTKWNARVR